MKLTVVGTGYVGLVSGACFAEMGNDVLCIDVDAGKIERLLRGELPIFEPGLKEIVLRNVAEGRLHFSTDVKEGVRFGTMQFIAVGTPPGEDGSADMQHVLAAARSIGEHMSDYKLIIDKSTVPVGTADMVREQIVATLKARGMSKAPFSVVSNPEFLKEGAAVDDFMRPDRIVVGVDDERAALLMRALYAPFQRQRDKLVLMDVRSAELTKYAANAMLATRISFMNEVAGLAERVGADIEQVRLGLGSDSRIGTHFLYAGCGWGGSCFPKDVKALARMGRDAGAPMPLVAATQQINQRQRHLIAQRVVERFGDVLTHATFALWGLAFKPGTDDLREAPSRIVIDELLRRGARVRAFDPVAMPNAAAQWPERAGLELASDPYDAAQGANALLIVTEWREFRSPDFARLREAMAEPLIFDGRNLYEPALLAREGFEYVSIGRPTLQPESQTRREQPTLAAA